MNAAGHNQAEVAHVLGAANSSLQAGGFILMASFRW